MAYPEYEGEVTDLSPGGLLIRSRTIFPVHTLLVIEIHFPGSPETFVRGEVIRIPREDPAALGMAVSLSAVTEEYLFCLKSFYIL